MRYIVDKMPEKPTDCPFSQPTLHHADWWCDKDMQLCPYFTTEHSNASSCLGLVSMTGLISKLTEKQEDIMLKLYARYNNDELRALQGLCLDFCCYQKDRLYSEIYDCVNCETRHVCKDLTSLAHHCETLINSRKSAHC